VSAQRQIAEGGGELHLSKKEVRRAVLREKVMEYGCTGEGDAAYG